MKNDEGHYVLTIDDVDAYKRILDATYDLEVRSVGERGLETHGYWKVIAPAKDKIYHTADGGTLEEAVTKWFDRLKKVGTEPFFE